MSNLLLLGLPVADLVVALTPLEVLLLVVLDGLGVLLLEGLFGVTVEEEVNLDLPRDGTGDGTAQTEDLTGQQPVHHTDGVLTAVVARDGDVNVLQRRVGIAKGDHRDVDQAGLVKGLVIGTGIGDDEDTGLDELGVDLVGEGTGDEAAALVGGAGVLGVLEDGTLTEQTHGADGDISGVLDGDDDTGGEHQLLPGGVEVDDVDTVLGAASGVAAHLVAAVLGTEVDVAGQHLLDVLLGGAEHLGAGIDGGHNLTNKVQKL
eukprot:285673_1